MGDLFTIITNISTNVIPAFDLLVKALMFIFGLIMIILGLMRMSRMAQGGPASGQSIAGPLVTVMIGFAFIALISTITVTSQTFLGVSEISDASKIFAYAPSTLDFASGEGGVATRASAIIVALVSIIQFIGLIAIVRSLFLFNETSQGQGQSRLGAAFTFLIAGICAVNFPVFMGMIEATIT